MLIGRTHIVAFLSAFVVSLALTPILRRFAISKGWLDQPDGERKIHIRPIPRIGGIAIILGFYTPMVGALLYRNKLSNALISNTHLLIGLFIGGFLTFLIGLYDDIKGANALKKLAAQITIAIVCHFLGYHFDTLRIPLVGTVHIWPPLSLVLTIIWFVILMNAMNLVDGLDGLAAGVSFFVLLTLGILAYLDKDVLLLLFIASLTGAVGGFWPFNRPPATIFMGDTGSLFLGFVLAAVSIRTASKASTLVAMFVPLFAMGLPLMDTLLAILRRLLKRKPIMSADREHIHHKLLDSGLSPQSSVYLLYVITILFGIIAIIFKIGNRLESYLAILSIGVVGGAIFKFSGLTALLQRKVSKKSFNEMEIKKLMAEIIRSWDSGNLKRLSEVLERFSRETEILYIGIKKDGVTVASSKQKESLLDSSLLLVFSINGPGTTLEARVRRGDFDTTVLQTSWLHVLAWRFGHPSQKIHQEDLQLP